MGDYGVRKCLNCGKEFVAQYPASCCCSDECKKKRARVIKNAIDRRHIKKLREKSHLYDDLVQEHEKLKAECKAFEAETKLLRSTVKQLREEIEQLKAENEEPEKESEGVFAGKTLNYCERMKLKTTQPLPCGQKLPCFQPPCEHLPKGAKL